MRYASALFLLSLGTLIVILPPAAVAQQNEKDRIRNAVAERSAGRRKLNREPSMQVTAELTRQQQFLRDLTTRYEAVSVHELVPLLRYPYIWNALRENRDRLEASRRRLTTSHSRFLTENSALLENDVLQLFIGQQIGILNDVLELDEEQLHVVQTVLAADLEERRSLLAKRSITGSGFAQRASELSVQTEKRIVSILSSEQQRRFVKQSMFNRNRLVG